MSTDRKSLAYARELYKPSWRVSMSILYNLPQLTLHLSLGLQCRIYCSTLINYRQSEGKTNIVYTVLPQLFKNVKAKGIRVSPSMEERLFLVLSSSSRPAQIPAKSPTKKENVRVHFPSLLGEGVEGLVAVYAELVTPTQKWCRWCRRLRLSGELMIRIAGSRCLRLYL